MNAHMDYTTGLTVQILILSDVALLFGDVKHFCISQYNILNIYKFRYYLNLPKVLGKDRQNEFQDYCIRWLWILFLKTHNTEMI